MKASPLTRWTLPFAAVAVGTAFRASVGFWVGDHIPYGPFFLAVAVTAHLAGFWPAMLACVLSALASVMLFISQPRFTLNVPEPHDIGAAVLFVLIGAVIAGLGYFMHKARQLAERLAEDTQAANTLLREKEARLQDLIETLRESERKYRVVAHHTHDWEFWLSPAGSFLYNSPSCLRLTGYPPEAFERDPELLHRIVHPEDQALYNEHSGTGDIPRCTSERLEFRIICADGAVRWIEHLCKPIQEDGAFLGIRGANRDITQRKADEAALHESEERFRGTFENAAVGITHTDKQGRWLRVNQKLCDIVGYSRDEIARMAFPTLTHPDDRHTDWGQYERMFAGEIESYRVEKRYLRKDGTIVWLDVQRSLQRDQAGSPLYAINVVHDISDRKRADAELEAARISAERAKAAAENANAAKDHFLAVLSHELRTPLAPVLAGLALLERKQCGDCALRGELEVMRRNLELEARLIDDLLDVTGIARGKISLDIRPVRICTILERAIEVCKPDIAARGLRLDVAIEDPPHPVQADMARMQQVFWNLLKNAVKFTPPGGAIGVHCRAVDGRVVVEVSDTGIGIERGAAPRIFGAFEQGDGSVGRQFGGLGLGLAISKRLIEMHRGTIEVHSEGRGKGSIFRVTLPREPSAARTPAADDLTRTVKEPAPCRVLLVEDHGDTAVMMKQLLEVSGYHVETAGDVAHSLELAKAHAFDLLISDLGLPDRSGLELMKELQEQNLAPPGIALSGYGREDDIKRSKDAGFAAHLTKPVDFDVLLRTMQTVVAECR